MSCKTFLKNHNLLSILKRHKATVINGKSVAQKVLHDLRKEVKIFSKSYHNPLLTVIQVGENPASELYIKNKVAAANVVGINVNILRFPSNTTENELTTVIQSLNDSNNVDAVLIQLPLPSTLSGTICQLISPEKDVDGFTAINFGKFCLNMESLVPCTALAVQYILREIGVNITGKNAVICGKSKHVGLPIAMILHSSHDPNMGSGANVTICHKGTPSNELTNFCRQADILISATGVPSLIRGHMIKKGAIIIDVGISRISQPNSSRTKIVGDVSFSEALEVAGFITPVPGGVGPMTVAMLMRNTLLAAKRRSI